MIRKAIIMGLLAVMMCATTSSAFAEDVYVTKNGKKYHKAECRLMKDKNPTALSKTEAVEKNYTPCKRCYKEDVVKDEIKENKKK